MVGDGTSYGEFDAREQEALANAMLDEDEQGMAERDLDDHGPTPVASERGTRMTMCQRRMGQMKENGSIRTPRRRVWMKTKVAWISRIWIRGAIVDARPHPRSKVRGDAGNGRKHGQFRKRKEVV